MFAMRILVIMATVAVASVHMLWRVVRPPKPSALSRQWAADE
jgi:hypothetical protein